MSHHGPGIPECGFYFFENLLSAEIHACQVELISGVCRSAEEAIADLRALRDAVLGVGVGLLGTGIHPTGREGEAEITDKERYNFISALLGDAIVDPVGARRGTFWQAMVRPAAQTSSSASAEAR